MSRKEEFMAEQSRRACRSEVSSGRQRAMAGNADSNSRRAAMPSKGAVMVAQQCKKRVPLDNLTNKDTVHRKNGVSDGQGFTQATTSKIRSRGTPSGRHSEVHKISGKSSLSIHRGKCNAVLKDQRSKFASTSSVSFHPDESVSSSGAVESNIGSTATSDLSVSPEVVSRDGSAAVIAALERKVLQSLYISKDHSKSKSFPVHPFEECSQELVRVQGSHFTDIDSDHKDPQLCTLYACDIYDHLHKTEKKRRPKTEYMEMVQKDMNTSMRGILIDWLVEVAEEYKLVPETLFLTVSCIDRYLSYKVASRQRLQLLGISCMLIASKHEEICPPQVEEFCYITDNTYFREEVLEMEREVLAQLHFELSVPTTKSFLGRFLRAAQVCNKSLQLEFLANYLAELTLLEYSFLQYLPSLIAASIVFLSKLTLDPTRRPWNATLEHYTRYLASELCDCVKALHELQCNSKNWSLSAIRDKYSQHKFKCVSTLMAPVVIPCDLFVDVNG